MLGFWILNNFVRLLTMMRNWWITVAIKIDLVWLFVRLKRDNILRKSKPVFTEVIWEREWVVPSPMECHFIDSILIWKKKIRTMEINFSFKLFLTTGKIDGTGLYIERVKHKILQVENQNGVRNQMGSSWIKLPYHIWLWSSLQYSSLLYYFHIYEDWKFPRRLSEFSFRGVVECTSLAPKSHSAAPSWVQCSVCGPDQATG